uniref:Synaptogyrin n=1 Tax=Astyanax mexicanus TaxID=7994 RepID=A0A8B9L4P7_ASTMX
MDGVGSFGAGRAGSAFDPLAFIQQPQTILRILSWIFSMVVFGSIINEGYVNFDSETLYCVFNKNYDACNYGITIGLVAFIACIFFMILDMKFQQISSVKDRKKAVMLEIGFSGFWTFMWFVCFCFLANQWQRTTTDELPLNQGADAARAAIAFSFFSIFTWVHQPSIETSTQSYCAAGVFKHCVHSLSSNRHSYLAAPTCRKSKVRDRSSKSVTAQFVLVFL